MQETYFEEATIKDKKFQKHSIEHCRFLDCRFENCTFEECSLSNCVFANCSFFNCTIISPVSNYSEVKNAVFQNCNLIGIHWSELRPSGRYGHSIERLENCFIKYNLFTEMSFIKFDFSSNVILESVFEKCSMYESNFRTCRMEATQIIQCDIRKADFQDARGYVIDITSNKMKQAKFSFPDVIALLDPLEITIV